MSSQIYTQGLTALMTGQIDLTVSANMYAALVKDTYTEAPSHQYTDVSSHIAGTSNSAFVGLTGCAVNSGTFDAADATFNSVASGSTVEGLLIYHDTGSVKTLIAYVTFPSTFATNGANVVVSFNGSGIFKL